jgi:hypothetical protein
MPQPDLVYEPFNLGGACETKFQICRKLSRDYFNKDSKTALRLQLAPPERGWRTFGWSVFDWERMPFSALLAYLERDFEGVFERADLELASEYVMHKTLETEHSHLLEGYRADWTEDNLDSTFPAAQRAFNRRAKEFREHLLRPGPFLYIWSAGPFPQTLTLPPIAQVERLLELLRAKSPDHKFHLLLVGSEGDKADYSSLDGLVTKAFRKSDPEKPPNRDWEGNDDAWDLVLAPYRFTFHDRGPPATAAAPMAADPTERKPSLFERLLRR